MALLPLSRWHRCHDSLTVGVSSKMIVADDRLPPCVQCFFHRLQHQTGFFGNEIAKFLWERATPPNASQYIFVLSALLSGPPLPAMPCAVTMPSVRLRSDAGSRTPQSTLSRKSQPRPCTSCFTSSACCTSQEAWREASVYSSTGTPGGTTRCSRVWPPPDSQGIRPARAGEYSNRTSVIMTGMS